MTVNMIMVMKMSNICWQNGKGCSKTRLNKLLLLAGFKIPNKSTGETANQHDQGQPGAGY